MTLTKAHLIEALFAKNIFTKTQSAQIMDTLFELMKQSLENGEDVSGICFQIPWLWLRYSFFHWRIVGDLLLRPSFSSP